jgi:hypothetical protein
LVLLRVAEQRGLEGVVSKREGRAYDLAIEHGHLGR